MRFSKIAKMKHKGSRLCQNWLSLMGFALHACCTAMKAMWCTNFTTNSTFDATVETGASPFLVRSMVQCRWKKRVELNRVQSLLKANRTKTNIIDTTRHFSISTATVVDLTKQRLSTNIWSSASSVKIGSTTSACYHRCCQRSLKRSICSFAVPVYPSLVQFQRYSLTRTCSIQPVVKPSKCVTSARSKKSRTIKFRKGREYRQREQLQQQSRLQPRQLDLAKASNQMVKVTQSISRHLT